MDDICENCGEWTESCYCHDVTTHELKIKKKYMLNILMKTKTFEIRKNDRGFKVNDLIRFKVIDALSEYEWLEFKLYRILYIFDGGEYGLSKEYCVMSIYDASECDEVGVADDGTLCFITDWLDYNLDLKEIKQ